MTSSSSQKASEPSGDAGSASVASGKKQTKALGWPKGTADGVSPSERASFGQAEALKPPAKAALSVRKGLEVRKV